MFLDTRVTIKSSLIPVRNKNVYKGTKKRVTSVFSHIFTIYGQS